MTGRSETEAQMVALLEGSDAPGEGLDAIATKRRRKIHRTSMPSFSRRTRLSEPGDTSGFQLTLMIDLLVVKSIG